MYTVYGRMYGDVSANNTVYTPYIRIYVWFWPTLHIYTVHIRYYLQGFHQIYGPIRRLYTVLANPSHKEKGAISVISTEELPHHRMTEKRNRDEEGTTVSSLPVPFFPPSSFRLSYARKVTGSA